MIVLSLRHSLSCLSLLSDDELIDFEGAADEEEVEDGEDQASSSSSSSSSAPIVFSDAALLRSIMRGNVALIAMSKMQSERHKPYGHKICLICCKRIVDTSKAKMRSLEGKAKGQHVHVACCTEYKRVWTKLRILAGEKPEDDIDIDGMLLLQLRCNVCCVFFTHSHDSLFQTKQTSHTRRAT